MLTFLSILFLFMIAGACMTSVLYKAIQEGEALGFWQKVLKWFYAKGWYNTEKFLGGCYQCFSHFLGIVWFVLYVIFNKYFLETSYGWWYLLWYLIFVPMTINISLIIDGIIKRLNK